MNWEPILLAAFPREQNEQQSLPNLVDDLFTHQIAHWPLLRENIRNCAQAEIKMLTLGHFDVRMQSNPARMRNTTANLEQSAIRQRLCKLCPQQLFLEQRGVQYRERFVLLCNPFPILERHLSIVDVRHVPQAIEGRLPLILELARDLSQDVVVFYNGPRCGASTPEHFHVQAGGAQDVPVLEHHRLVAQEVGFHQHKHILWQEEKLEIFTLKDYHVQVLIYHGTDASILSDRIEYTINQFAELTGSADEQLISLLVHYTPPMWNVYLFPRAKHRPAGYFDGTFVVSPASLDMASYMAIPVKEHFENVHVDQVQQVYNEVSLAPELFAQLVRKIVT